MMEAKIEGVTQSRARTGMSVACALLVVLLVFLFHSQFSKSNYLFSDSADYVRAARSPFLPMYLNTDSASPVQLFVLRKDPVFRAHPWDYLYFRGDNAAIRHFHVPFSFYTMHAVSRFTSKDANQRRLSSLVTAVTCGAVVIGLTAFDVPVAVAGMLALVAGIQSRYIDVSVDPSPHGWYMLFAVLFLFTFAGYLNERRFRILVVSAILLGFAFATLEFSLELVASIPLALVFLWFVKRSALGDVKALAISFAKVFPLFCLTTFVLWPGGWLRGGYLESYGVTGSTVLLKNHALFGEHPTAAGMYRRFFGGHEALLLLVAFALFAFAFALIRQKLSVVTVLFISYTAVACALGIADHFRLDTYISEALLFLLITVALLFKDTLAGVMAGSRHFAVIAAVAVLAVVCAQEWSRRDPLMIYEPWLKPIVVGVSAEVPPGSTVLVNGNLEEYYAYLPKYHFEPTVSVFNVTPRNIERARGIRFFLFDNEAPKIPHTRLLKSFPTAIPGQSINLYEEN